MSTMSCTEFIARLDAWMEGDRDPQARAHARDCDLCRGFAGDLDAIQSAAPALAVADPEPPARIWAALRQQLAAEGLINQPITNGQIERSVPPDLVVDAQPVGQPRPRQSWLEGLLAALPRPALAAAYLILLCALALGLAGLHTQPAFPVSSQLADAERSAVSSAPAKGSTVSASLSQNLAIVDNYITLCERSVREEPGNEIAREYLYQAYQQKVDLLAEMTQRGDSIR
jgi:hypothetical protein